MLQLDKLFNYCTSQAISFFRLPFLILLFSLFCFEGFSQESCTCSLTLSSGTTYLKGLIQANLLPNTGTASNGCIKVPANSTLIINVNYTFENFDFKMGTGSKIIVNSRILLTISDGSYLYPCSTDWGGIELMEGISNGTEKPVGGKLDMSDSEIERANLSIWAKNNSYIRLVNNDFVNHDTGLKISGHVRFLNNLATDFTENQFLGDYPESPGGDLAIHFDSAINFTIGEDNSSSTVKNYIYDHVNGVRIENSTNISLFGIKVERLYPMFAPNLGAQSTAIASFSTRNLTVKYCHIQGLNITNGFGVFNTPGAGIFEHQGMGTNNFSNNLISAFFPIIIEEAMETGSTFSVADNIIYSWGGGIYVADTYSSSPNYQIYISGNHIKVAFAGAYAVPIINNNFGPAPSAAGIALGSVNAGYYIGDNLIENFFTAAHFLPVVYSGISIQNCNSSAISINMENIIHNTINIAHGNTIAPAYFDGISCYSSNQCTILDNPLVSAKSFASSAPGINHGMFFNSCQNFFLWCNTIDQSKYGVSLTSSNKVNVATTKFLEHDNGLYYFPASSNIPLNNRGNNWTLASTTWDAYYEGNIFQAKANAPYQTDDALISTVSPNGWVVFDGEDVACSGQFPEFTDLNAELMTLDTTSLLPVAFENEDVLRFQQQRQLFRKLKDHPMLMVNNDLMTGFFEEALTSNIAIFDSVDQKYLEIFKLSAPLQTDIATINSRITIVNQTIDSIKNIYDGLSLPDKLAADIQIGYFIDSILLLQAAFDTINIQVADEMNLHWTSLTNLNNTITSNDIWEGYEKGINDLFFKCHGSLIDSFSEDQIQYIEFLSEQCPQYYGNGVYKARLLRSKIDTTAYYNDTECLNERSNMLPETSRNSGISPNPARDYINLQSLPEEGTKTISLKNLDGISLKQVTDISGDMYRFEIPANMPEGLYFLIIQSLRGSSKTYKVVIIH